MNLLKFFLLILFITYSYSSPIFIDGSKKQEEILSSSEIYIDKTKKLNIDDIYHSNIKFEKTDKTLLGFGYSPDFNVWVKFTLKNTSDKKIFKILEYENSNTTNISFYENNKLVKNEGLLDIAQDRKTLTPIFKVELDAYEQKTYYVKTFSYITTLIIKLKLWDTDEFYKKEIKHQVILALFFGAMIILALYNLFIFFFIKDISYLYYVLYIFGIVLHQTMYVGFGALYLGHLDIIDFIVEYATIFVVFPAIALALFTKTFLNTFSYKKMDLILNIFIIIVLISSLFFIYSDEYNHYRNLFPFLLLVYLMFITIYAVYKKNRQAYFIVFGWIIFLTSGSFMYLSSAGVFNIYDIFPYYVEVSLVLEAVIFSIALADRIKQLQKERNEINEKLIAQQMQEGNKLKNQVENKTRDLKEALDEKGLLLKELSHRVKNNMQMIISLIRLQADDIDDKKVREVFTIVQNRIKAMSHLHELLYQQDKISHINAFDYFDMMIDDLKQSYDTEDIIIELDIQTELQIEQAIYCGLILNELVTNSIKYAFEGKHGTIKVQLFEKDNKFCFNIKDDGKGYKSKKNVDTLGLLLVETLCVKQLGGIIEIDTNSGVEVRIKWSKDDKNKSVNS